MKTKLSLGLASIVLGIIMATTVSAGSLPYNIGHVENFLNDTTYFNGWEDLDNMQFSGEWKYTAIGFESGHINIVREDWLISFSTLFYYNFGTFNTVNFDTDNLYFQDTDGPYNVALNPYTNSHYFEMYRLTHASNMLSYLPNTVSLDAGTIIVGFNDNGWSPVRGDSDYDDIIIAMTQVNPVPEPATMVLLGFGLIGLASIAKKRMKH